MNKFRTGEVTGWASAVAIALLAVPLAMAEAPAPGAKARIKPAAAKPAPDDMAAARRVDMAPALTLAEGKSTLMHLPYAATRLSVGNPAVADVVLINPTELYMLGKAVGSTNLILWNKAGDATVVDLSVTMDISALQARLSQLLAGEKDIKVSAAADSLVVSGTVSDVVKADQVIALANAYVQRSARGLGLKEGGDKSGEQGQGQGQAAIISPKVINMLSVGAPQQVMLEVKVAEVSKTLVDQLGSALGVARTAGSFTYTLLSNLLTTNPGALDAFNRKNGNFLTIDGQKRDGLIKVLAEPTIMSISGQEASFLAGGKIFIPVSQENSNGLGTRITLEEKEFGVAVKFTPTVLDGGRINLKVAPEVSELNREGIGITAAGTNVTAVLPSFTTRRAATTVQLFDGQSFAIGGLIKNNVTANIKALPFLGEVPVLGALFRSTDFQTDRSELVFIVTPRLVKPLPPDYRLPTDGYIEPTRKEYLMQGKLEGAPPKDQQAPAPAPAPAKPQSGFDIN